MQWLPPKGLGHSAHTGSHSSKRARGITSQHGAQIEWSLCISKHRCTPRKPNQLGICSHKKSVNKPLRNRCQWIGGSKGGWRAAGGCAHKADSARHCRVGSCRLCPSAYARPAARSSGASSWTGVPQGWNHETWHTPAARPSCRNRAAAESSVLRSALALVRPHRITEGSQYGVTAGYDGVAAHGRACTARRKGTATQPRADARGIRGYLW